MNARRAALVVAIVLIASACGTRLTKQSIEAAAYGSRGDSSTGGALGAGATPGASTADAGPTSVGPTTAGSARAAAAGSVGAPGASSSGGTAATTAGEPIRIGQIGTFSGILGGGLVGFKQTAQAWVANVNAKGGINGHPVKLVSADDGSDGAKGLSEVKDMVENQHVIAFVATPLLSSGSSVHGYLEQHRIPVIGGDVYDALWHQSPMLFPQSGFIDNAHYATAAASVQAGHTSFALLWCAEVAACGAAHPFQASAVKKLGAKVVYEGQISIAAPDYTAQCVQARQSGADVLWVSADSATINRVATSCDRQGYHPGFAAAAGSMDVNFPSNPAFQGLRGAVQEFPWFMTSGSPAMQEYGDVMKRYAPSATLQVSTSQAWTSMKLFEKVATAAIPAGGTPSTDALLRALWAIHDETLGGLTPPFSFVANQPAVKGECSFIVAVDRGRWTAPNGLQLTCGSP